MRVPIVSSRGVLGAVNRIVRNLGLSLAAFDVDSVVAAACERARLYDFGAPELRESLRLLLADLDTQSRLTPIGRLAARRDIVNLLAQRLGLVADRARYPAIADEEVARPLFIIGMPRTGTTLIHHLLGADPSHRVARAWEVMCPSPPPGLDRSESDPRIAQADRQLRWLDWLAPTLKTMHPLGAHLGLECIAIMSYSLLSSRFDATYRVPRYQAWLARQDHRPAYEFHRRFLQHLQWRTPSRRWVLKAPAHLPTLEALLAVYPDALIVQTHRDPVVALASVASLNATLRGAFSDDVDQTAIGPVEARRWATAVERGIEVRASGRVPAEQFVDVHYQDLIADPLGTVQGIYRSFDLPFTEAVARRMHAHLTRHPKDANGAHRYSLAACGLDPDEVSRRFKAYREHFGIASEPVPV